MIDTVFISLPQLAGRLGLSEAWLKRETDAGRLPCVRAGKSRKYQLDAVVATLIKQQVVADTFAPLLDAAEAAVKQMDRCGLLASADTLRSAIATAKGGAA